jgi:hypothetical protein
MCFAFLGTLRLYGVKIKNPRSKISQLGTFNTDPNPACYVSTDPDQILVIDKEVKFLRFFLWLRSKLFSFEF